MRTSPLDGAHRRLGARMVPFGGWEMPLAYGDGTVAEHGYLRAVDQNVRRRQIEGAGGQLVLVAGRVGGKMNIGVTAYEPGARNTKPRLRALAADVLAEFGISGEVL